ncbi:MAG: hypothetical protein GY847_06310 [Proteobacteria bacterium]|nr:hypothetical protein [Pseudomonadota bacterium]
MDERVKFRPKMLAAASLVLSTVSLIVYVNIIAGVSTVVFVIFTGGAFAAGVLSLTLGLIARKQSRQEPQRKNQLLVMMSIVVAIAYLICISIVILSILVRWVF